MLVRRRAALLLAISAAPASAAELRVIGAGMGRTGTDSLRHALNALGVGPTYHMAELLGISDTLARPVSPLEMLGLAPGHNDLWAEANRNISAGVPPDFSAIMEHYASAVDFPSAAFWPELLEAYPDAKVVLTVREPHSLHRSISGSWCRLIGSGSRLDRLVAQLTFLRPYGKRNKRMHEAMAEGTARILEMPGFSWVKACDDETYAVAAFKEWDARVKAAVPSSRLLIFETGKHGYPELARFLGVEEPTEPYPRRNSASEFGFVIGLFRALSALSVGVPCALLWSLAHSVLWCLRRRARGRQGRGANQPKAKRA